VQGFYIELELAEKRQTEDCDDKVVFDPDCFVLGVLRIEPPGKRSSFRSRLFLYMFKRYSVAYNQRVNATDLKARQQRRRGRAAKRIE
jgi:hypothetical protein